jgi:hypothetical protein
MEKNEETQGEDLIADFLEDNSIDFKRYYIIPKLEGDDKFFREADFYLPRYGVYIEFLGRWNNPYDQSRYRQKMAIYHKNKLACIYLWPDNLGTLDWMFRRRLREALLKYNRIWTLLTYEFENYLGENFVVLLIVGLVIYYMKEIKSKIVISLLLAVFLFTSIQKYVKRLQKIKKSKWVSSNNPHENNEGNNIKN